MKALVGDKTYKWKRALQNKGLMGDIVNTIETKQLCMILEWVKGHETMSEERHNWISKLKQQGNDIADKAAQEAAEGEKEAIDFQLEHSDT